MTIGRNGTVQANIIAREVVVMGKVNGNIECSDRVDIRSEGSVTGDVSTVRISVEDGAVLKGGIEVRSGEQKQNQKQQTQSKAGGSCRSQLRQSPPKAHELHPTWGCNRRAKRDLGIAGIVLETGHAGACPVSCWSAFYTGVCISQPLTCITQVYFFSFGFKSNAAEFMQ